MEKIRHVLGLSGGKDSTALAIYINTKYPSLDIEYYFCDTGKELEETYQIIDKLEVVLGKKILRLEAVNDSPTGSPFDHFLEMYGGYLPSSASRWCTRQLKLEPFEKYVGDDPVISFVGIRGDENREAYISKKPNIQSIFPFRKNIWSEDVISFVLKNENIFQLSRLYKEFLTKSNIQDILNIVNKELSIQFPIKSKLDALLDIDIITFNKCVLEMIRNTNYPLSSLTEFPVIDNTDVLGIEDIIQILEDSGVGMPQYYNKIEYETDGLKGNYARSRSGCYFCFYQQKIEWVWLYEQHPDLYKKAMEYEKDGFTWNQGESLESIIQEDRLKQIKEDHIKKTANKSSTKSDKLINILEEDNEGCAACFI